MPCHDMLVQRYYQLLKAYLVLAKQIESCATEDKAFYQDVCLSFATKIKTMQAELAGQGFILCEGQRTLPCMVVETKKNRFWNSLGNYCLALM